MSLLCAFHAFSGCVVGSFSRHGEMNFESLPETGKGFSGLGRHRDRDRDRGSDSVGRRLSHSDSGSSSTVVLTHGDDSTSTSTSTSSSTWTFGTSPWLYETCHGHGHGHGIFILATYPQGTSSVSTSSCVEGLSGHKLHKPETLGDK